MWDLLLQGKENAQISFQLVPRIGNESLLFYLQSTFYKDCLIEVSSLEFCGENLGICVGAVYIVDFNAYCTRNIKVFLLR